MVNETLMADLFEHAMERKLEEAAPLADRLRPRRLDEMVGHGAIVGEGTFLGDAIRDDRVPSILVWGPPGCGKTTLAHVIAKATQSHFEQFSAVLGGVKEVRAIVDDARRRLSMTERKTILFVDEIHRFNKAQQDAFLPHVENGTITLIGATTENPSFSVNNALLSRCRVVAMSGLGEEDLLGVLRRALDDKDRGLGSHNLKASDEILSLIGHGSEGDARHALGVLEQASLWALNQGETELTEKAVEESLSGRVLRYDRNGDGHFQIISAFIKSMRGSDPDAAVYYMCRMLDAGEDPLFILRRVVIFASEDVGNADPRALSIAVSAMQAFQSIGLPEGAIVMAQAVTYCASAPKSNASYKALNEARAVIQETGSLPVPKHLINAHTSLSKSMGHGEGYDYPHDHAGGFVSGVKYLPDELNQHRFYRPKDFGFEKFIRERLEGWHGPWED